MGRQTEVSAASQGSKSLQEVAAKPSCCPALAPWATSAKGVTWQAPHGGSGLVPQQETDLSRLSRDCPSFNWKPPVAATRRPLSRH